jgi:hypothetical protein
MKALLLYLWQHRGEEFGQYAIAVDALDRPPSFDPKIDSTVRVQIARLRSKLKEYYEREGASNPLRLSIPRGQHTLHWEFDPLPVAKSPAIPVPYLMGLMTAVAVLALAGCLYLWRENRTLQASMPDPLPRFWRSFLAGGKAARIVVPSPFFFYWRDRKVYMRDLAVSEFSQATSSPAASRMFKEWGQPEAAPFYVGSMDMSAGLRLLQYLEKRGQSVEMIESRGFSFESLGNANTIFIGIPRTTGYLEPFAKRLNFYMSGMSPDVVTNRHPNPREPAEFRQMTQAPDRSSHPAIIAVLPMRPEQKTRSIFLFGRVMYGITSILTSREGLAAVEAAWTATGSPDAWEMVIEADIEQNTVHKVRPVTLRAIAPDFWDKHSEPAR